eukprot:GSMAST32.ASY1.ANO1.473.1 assembled CDS
MYEKAAQGIEDDVLEGYNCVIFAYGQTGTGKTHTMQGSLEKGSPHAGIIPRMCTSIFEKLETKKCGFDVKVTAIELYNERFFDCIDPVNSNEKTIKVQDTELINAEEVAVKKPSEIYDLMQNAQNTRKVSATKMNKQSSRSHFIFILTVRMKVTTTSGEDEIKNGKLFLVDLAGSECIGKSGAEGMRATEAKNINKSNEALKRVIQALAQNHSHIPYRDSQLTQLLQPALGGSAKTIIIGTISPAKSGIGESKSTLRYMCMAKTIKNDPTKNQRMYYMTQRGLLRDLERQNERLKLQLITQRNQSGVFLSQEHHDENIAEIARLTKELKTNEEKLKVTLAE